MAKGSARESGSHEETAQLTSPNEASHKQHKQRQACPDNTGKFDEFDDLPLPASTSAEHAEREKTLVDNGKAAEQDGDELPTPPDGGWGWVVVFASFMVHIIADGVAYSFGIFYVEFIDYFKSGRGETGWVSSLVVGVTFTSGPIASALTNKYGCRPVTIAGAVLAALGFIISIFTPNLYFLYFSFGILAGLGLGLIYLPAIVSVSYYFERKRAFATGLAVCGSGIGTFIFAPLCKQLVDVYTWKGACLILAALLLNCCICGALFRPLEARRKKKREHLTSTGTNGSIMSKEVEMRELTSKNDYSSKARISLPTDAQEHDNSVANRPLLRVNDNISRSFHSLHVTDPLHLPVTDNLRKHKSEHAIEPEGTCPPRPFLVERQSSRISSGKGHPMYRKDIFYSASLLNIPSYRSNPALYSRSVTSIPVEVEENDKISKLLQCCHCSKEMMDAFKQMTDFSLLKDPIFLMFAISNLFTSIGFNMPYIFLPDRAQLAGMSKDQGAFLISVIGISNTVGRIIFGWVADRPFICQYRLYVYNTALFLCGICTGLSVFANTYGLLVTYAASYGLFIGTYVTLTSVILVDLLGLDRLTSSFGLLLIFQGVATIVGPPIAGWVYDATGSYDAPFIITGTMIGLSGFMLYFIPLVRRLFNQSQCKETHQNGIEVSIPEEPAI